MSKGYKNLFCSYYFINNWIFECAYLRNCLSSTFLRHWYLFRFCFDCINASFACTKHEKNSARSLSFKFMPQMCFPSSTYSAFVRSMVEIPIFIDFSHIFNAARSLLFFLSFLYIFYVLLYIKKVFFSFFVVMKSKYKRVYLKGMQEHRNFAL